MGATMRWLVLVIFALSASCGSPNPDFCCVTEEQCAAAGVVDELRPCGLGQACSASNQCVAKECETSLDCADPNRPTCVNNLCVEGCAVDDDCRGQPDAPHCDAETAACVGCLGNDQCPAEAEICDAGTRSCRGCVADEDCGEGVCIEATGVCVDSADVIYVTDGGVDTADCPKAAPCSSISFALGLVTNVRKTIKILSTSLNPQGLSLGLENPVTIDGSETRLTLRGNPGVAVTSIGTLIENVSLRYEGTNNLITVGDGAALTVYSSTFEENALTSSQIDGDLAVLRSDIQRGSQLLCELGKLAIRDSRFTDSAVETSGCTLEIERSRFSRGVNSPFGSEILRSSGGLATIENNLFLQTELGANTLRMALHVAGSVFRFNTVGHTTTTPNSATTINCTGIELSNNIIAAKSSIPFSSGCSARQTLFDAEAGTQPGDNNITADGATFFVNSVTGDFHLAADSPAKEMGEGGLVIVDLEGTPRPAANPDVGAFEAP